MTNQKIILESLAMDLRRVALGLHRGSYTMAKRFKDEVEKREKELQGHQLNSYLKKLIKKTKESLHEKNDRIAEDLLMYSILLQNYTRKHLGIDEQK